MGVATGCGCKEVYRFPHTTSLLLLYQFFFTVASLLFVHFFMFFVLVYIRDPRLPRARYRVMAS